MWEVMVVGVKGCVGGQGVSKTYSHIKYRSPAVQRFALSSTGLKLAAYFCCQVVSPLSNGVIFQKFVGRPSNVLVAGSLEISWRYEDEI